MSRRIIIIGLAILLAAVLVAGFLLLRKKSASVSDPLGAIPVDAALILQINDFRSFSDGLFRKNMIFKDLQALKPFGRLSTEILFLDSLARENQEFGEFMYNSTLYMSGHYIGGRKVNFLFVQQSKHGEPLRNMIDLPGKFTGEKLNYSERKYEGESIFTLKLKPGDPGSNLYIGFLNRNVLISRSVILVENAIRQSSMQESLTDDRGFVAIASTAGKNKDANFYIDLRKFPAFIASVASDAFSSKLRNTKHFGGWAELDLNVNDKQIMLNGFVGQNSAENSFLAIMESNKPVSFSIDKILPASVSAFITIGAEDMARLQGNFKLYLSAGSKNAERDNRLKEIDKRYGVRLDEIFTSLLGNEITFAQGGYDQASENSPASYVLLKCKSGSQAERTLNSVAEKMIRVQGGNRDQFSEPYSIDADTKFPILRMPVEDISGLLFGGLFSIPGKNYVTFLGNYMVISGSQEALGHFLYANVLSRTLSTNAAYKKFSNNIDQDSYLLFYTNLSRSAGVFRKYLNSEIIRGWEENYDKLQKIQSLGVQYTSVSNMGYFNMLLQYVDDAKGKPQTVWESLLDTAFTFKPCLIDNHYTHQKEIFLQDRNNTIYLINKAGRILWKQTIVEAINSEVFQIDFYRNGKLQILFSTENYLHLIDRNGNYVERYPVRLRDRATAGMSLFDYERNRDYRIFIPCANKQVYAYSKEGNVLNGWQFKGAESIVSKPINHFRVGEKDFIAFTDNYKTYVLDRRGDSRVAVNTLFTHSSENNLFLEDRGTTDKSFIYTTDTAGTIQKIGFDGKVQTITIENFAAGHYFDLKDVNADGEKDFIFLDHSTLYAFKQDKTEIFRFNFPGVISEPPIYFRFSYSDRKIGITDTREQKIYLINNNGDLYKGFPLEGHTMFSIGYLEGAEGDFNLIVGGRNNFLYNYSVQ